MALKTEPPLNTPEDEMIWIGIGIGAVGGPVAVVAALWFLRDVLPPILFVPSDWD